MIKKIEKPSIQWEDPFYERAFNQWFDKNIEPLNRALDEAVEVYGFHNSHGYEMAETNVPSDKYKALLINIEPIKQETREERLEAFAKVFIGEYEGPSIGDVAGDSLRMPLAELYEYAKAALEREHD